jgi:hypothetical protein
MKNGLLLIILSLFTIRTSAQAPTFNIKYSEPLAVFVFVKKLTPQYGENPFKKAFQNSKFYTPQYKNMLAQFDSLQLDYTYEFRAFPYGSKLPGMTEALLQKNLIAATSLNDFKLRSVGLIPNSTLIQLSNVLAAFTPVYNELIYNPNKEKFEKQLKDISAYATAKNISGYFEMGLTFYNSYWDNAIPFEIAFYPLPNSQGFTANAFYNNAVSAIQTDFNDYESLLSVMLHEIFHILYDEQSLAFKKEIDGYFKQNPSKYSTYAYLLMNEALATSLANGYVYEQLIQMPDTTSWYNKKYINLMAKQLYPMVKEYIALKKPIDKNFIDTYIQRYEQYYPEWITELSNTMTYRYMLSNHYADFDIMNQLYHAAMSHEEDEITETSIGKMKATILSKVVVVSTDHANTLALIKKQFPELKNWNYKANKEFEYNVFLKDRTQLYIINQHKTALIDLIKKMQ